MAFRCADSILINGKGRVNCRNPRVLTDMVPDSVKSVLQGMEYTVKGYVIVQDVAFGDTRAKWKRKLPSTEKHLCPNNVCPQLQCGTIIPV